MEIGSLAHICHLAEHVNINIRCAQEGSTGNAFIAFIYHFTNYSQKNNLDKNENVNNLISVMAQAYERKDILFVADILEYELIPLIKQIHGSH